MIVDGAGTLVLDATNTFTGGITVEQGTLELAAAGAAGSGPITFSGDVELALVLDAAGAAGRRHLCQSDRRDGFRPRATRSTCGA